MKESEEDLRRRIGALADADLVRVLSTGLDERPVREILAARAEARARNLHPGALGDEPRPHVPASNERKRFELTGAWEPERLYRPYSMLEIAAVAFACDACARILGQFENPEWQGILGLLVLAGWIEFMHALYRLHGVLRTATEGRYPISPLTVVVLNVIPCVNVIGCFAWTTKVARFGEVNGQSARSDRYVPALIYLASMGVMKIDAFASLLLMLASVSQLQSRLRLAMAAVPPREAPATDWSSAARA